MSTIIRAECGDAEARKLVALAGLSVHHSCCGCGALLVAYGRDPGAKFCCPECNILGKIVAMKHDKGKSQ